jgi:hypothetical protein
VASLNMADRLKQIISVFVESMPCWLYRLIKLEYMVIIYEPLEFLRREKYPDHISNWQLLKNDFAPWSY